MRHAINNSNKITNNNNNNNSSNTNNNNNKNNKKLMAKIKKLSKLKMPFQKGESLTFSYKCQQKWIP